MLANIVEKWCLRGWYKNQKIRNFSKSAGSRIISVSRLSSHHGFSRTPAVTT
ncbi:hypothetical protein [Endozoicomonas sp. SCSIO W0465]|uniref:hypothetical protein n=1 Tax=Endozoicomonas sp. SCSIO W0465 TaxID=2918516 RepID=UPI0020759878|nr:hypothetical protein [Endozoicomonas sp. SCSIO W0465]USE34640.1 hypothetical protein MJO57_21225 [Endozoicomonas sp. SCSIO W0465]